LFSPSSQGNGAPARPSDVRASSPAVQWEGPMCLFCRSVGPILAAFCLASCGQPVVRGEVSPPPVADQKAADSQLVVTGSRVNSPAQERDAMNYLPAPPPPAPGMMAQIMPWSPPYHDVGR